MKKKLWLITFAVIIALFSITALAADKITVKVDGKDIAFDVDPIIREGTTLVPLRPIFEALDAKVDWDDANKTSISEKNGITIKIKINSKTMQVGSKTVQLNYPAIILNSRALVPVRAISEAFGCQVGWDGNTKTVSVIKDKSKYTMLYAPGGRSRAFANENVNANLKAGWYRDAALKDNAVPIEYSGTGTTVLSNINIPAGSYKVNVGYKGTGYIDVKLYYGEDEYDYQSIVFERGDYAGVIALDEHMDSHAPKAVKNGLLEIKADGDWFISFEPISGTCTTNIKGSGDFVTGVINITDKRSVVSVSFSGDGYTNSKIYKLNGGKYDYESIAFEKGNYSGSKVLTLDPGKYFIAVESDGDWSIDFGKNDKLTAYSHAEIVIPGTSGGTSSGTSGGTSGGSVVSKPQGYGQVKGEITWQYNKALGTRGDNGAYVMLIPINDKVKTYSNSSAALFISGEYDSGIIVKKCDGYGRFDFGDSVPAGNYKVIIRSNNTTSEASFNNKAGLESELKKEFGRFFSDTDMEKFIVAIGYHKFATGEITVEDGYVNTITHDFGYTYI